MGHGLAILGERPNAQPGFLDRLLYGTLFYIAFIELVRSYVGAPAALVVVSLGFGAACWWSSAQAQALYLRTGFVFTLWLRWTLYALGVVQLIRIQGAFTGVAASAFVQDAVNLTIYSCVFVLGVLRYFFYVAIRLQEKVQVATQAAQLVEKTSLELATRNAFISTALREAPVACIVTDADSSILVGNKEAERLLSKQLPTFAQVGQARLYFGDLFVGLGASQALRPGQKKTFFSRSGHAGDARCLSVQGEAFPDPKGRQQQIFILRDEALTIQQATVLIQAESLEAGSSLLLVRPDGEVLAASDNWSAVQRESSCDQGVGLWSILESLQTTSVTSSVLAKAAATREGASKALQQAQKRVVQDGRSSSAFIRLANGRSCDVLFDTINLSDPAEKVVLVEVRVRSGAAVKAVEESVPEGLPTGLLAIREG